MDGVKIEGDQNLMEWKVKGMKIRMKIFSFDKFKWSENWEEWKDEKYEYYVLKLHL